MIAIRSLVIFAGAVFASLGMLHAGMALRDLGKPRFFTPRSPGLREAMQASSIGLHRSINLWKAWLGFNLSHSLGLVLFGAAFVYVGVFEPLAFVHSPLLQGCAVLVAATYLALSVAFWFSKPTLGAALGLAGFVLAAALSYVGGNAP